MVVPFTIGLCRLSRASVPSLLARLSATSVAATGFLWAGYQTRGALILCPSPRPMHAQPRPAARSEPARAEGRGAPMAETDPQSRSGAKLEPIAESGLVEPADTAPLPITSANRRSAAVESGFVNLRGSDTPSSGPARCWFATAGPAAAGSASGQASGADPDRRIARGVRACSTAGRRRQPCLVGTLLRMADDPIRCRRSPTCGAASTSCTRRCTSSSVTTPSRPVGPIRWTSDESGSAA